MEHIEDYKWEGDLGTIPVWLDSSLISHNVETNTLIVKNPVEILDDYVCELGDYIINTLAGPIVIKQQIYNEVKE